MRISRIGFVVAAAAVLFLGACGAPPETISPRDASSAGEAPGELRVDEFDDGLEDLWRGTLPASLPLTGEVDGVTTLLPGFVTITGSVSEYGRSGEPGGRIVRVQFTIDRTPSTQLELVLTSGDVQTADGGRRASFGADLPVASGLHDVCATVVDHERSMTTELGCGQVEVAEEPADRSECVLTAVTPTVDRALRIRGVVPAGGDHQTVTIRVSADDGTRVVEFVVPVDSRTFRADIPPLDDGRYFVCPVCGENEVRCGTASIGDVCAGTTGLPGTPVTVEAPLGHPMTRAERDAGVSVRLSDGSTLWFFGDTGERDTTGALIYFVNNTAAWAPADAPEQTLDAVGSDGEPPLFAAPTDNFCAGHRFGTPVLWPESAIALPTRDGTDQVLVVLSKVCTAPGAFNFEGVGLALAEYAYDPSDPPAHRPIRGTVVEPDFAPADHPYGRAMVRDGNGFVIGYQCGPMAGEQLQCVASRVPEADIADPAARDFWTGGAANDPASWSTDPAAAVPMDLPGQDERPYAAFTVSYDDDEHREVYLMAYSPWPVFTDRVVARVAVSPVGPWTHALPVELPGCLDDVADERFNCYAGTAQPAFGDALGIGLGFYDQLDLAGSGLGEYRACTVPFAVASATN